MSMVQLALRRPYTFIVMAMLIVLATPFALRNMATDIFPEIDIPVISIIWNLGGLRRDARSAASERREQRHRFAEG
jgi:multidrug efflux pump subunit AcrB